MRPYQTEAAQPNTLLWTEGQLLGLYGLNIADLTGAAGGLYVRDTVINFNIDAPNAVANLPRPTGTRMSCSRASRLDRPHRLLDEEVLTYIESQRLVSTSSASTATTGSASRAAGLRATCSASSLLLRWRARQFPTRVFSVVVDPPGIYPVRLIWENGSGELPANGANLEFFSVKDGVKTLINDTTARALKAYRREHRPRVRGWSNVHTAAGAAPQALPATRPSRPRSARFSPIDDTHGEGGSSTASRLPPPCPWQPGKRLSPSSLRAGSCLGRHGDRHHRVQRQGDAAGGLQHQLVVHGRRVFRAQ